MQTATLSTEPCTEPGAGIIYARVLTELDYEARGGFVFTANESKQSFLPGDSLVVDASGEWPIDANRLRADYHRLGAAESSGFARYLYVGQLPEKHTPFSNSPAGETSEPLAITITAWEPQA